MAKYYKDDKTQADPVEYLRNFVFALNKEEDNAAAIIMTREIARSAGFGSTDEVMIATAVSELSTNILRYATCGTVIISTILSNGRTGIEIRAEDKGPGIRNLNLAMQDNFSTSESLGLGLSSVERIMDTFEIESETGRGTRVEARKWLQRNLW